jgi:CMP-N-acetylneuraminic acid synthetase
MAENKILLTIAARGGSKGLKNKNIRHLCGHPLIAHTIMQARKWNKADYIICSTDSEEIARIAKSYGAQAPFIRPAELATDTAGKLDVLRHALKEAEKITGQEYSIIIDLDVTAPMRKLSDIDGCLKKFLDESPKVVFSVSSARKNPYFNMIRLDDKGYAQLVSKVDSPIKRRQDAPKVYDVNASIYVYDRSYLIDEKSQTPISDRSMVWIMDEFSAYDIDNEIDFQFIEFLISKGVAHI